MKRWIAPLVLGAMLGAAAMPAQADETTHTFIVKAGTLSPSGTNVFGNSALSFGLEYEWAHPNNNTAWSVSADYINDIDAFSTFTVNNLLVQNITDQSAVPLMFNYKWYSGTPSAHSRFYLGVGAGIFFGNYGGFGYQGMAGWQFSRNFEVEFRYLGDTGSSQGVGPSTLNSLTGVSAGYRF